MSKLLLAKLKLHGIDFTVVLIDSLVHEYTLQLGCFAIFIIDIRLLFGVPTL